MYKETCPEVFVKNHFYAMLCGLALLAGIARPAYSQSKIEILFAYGSEKEEWIKEVTAPFNRSAPKIRNGKVISIQPLATGSGECMEGVLSGTIKAHLVSPASALFIAMANAESRARSGKDLVAETENLVLSPVVIAMWKPMAEALGWGTKPIGWADILSLAKNSQGWGALGMPQWGRFKLGHTHPEYSNSGLISIIAEVYAAAGKTANLTLEDLGKPEVAGYVQSIEQALVHYGASTGFFGRKMFAEGPSYLSAAVLYENMVIEFHTGKYRRPFPLVAIYPKEGTFWSDHPAGLVAADWVTAEHREAAAAYLKFLLAKPQQERALAFGFRPGLADLAVTSPIDPAHGVDPKEPQTTLEAPSPEVIKAINQLWHKVKKRSNLALVFDTSGSMKEENRLENARQGALQMIQRLGDEDVLAMLPFNNKVAWAMKSTSMRSGREKVNRAIGGLWPEGGTALYDAILQAHQQLSANPQTDKISAIVVLTDGQDTSSRSTLAQLMNQIKFDSEKNNIRIFTIGYGQGANKKVLQSISDATQAKSYEGTNENIDAIFRDIATFF